MNGDTDVRTGRTAADLDQQAAAAPGPDAARSEDGGHPEQSGHSGGVDLGTDPLLDEIEEALRDVVDPELGINVVDLGLLYDLQVGADKVATIDMTLTSAACPLTDLIEEQVGAALLGDKPLVDDFRINWVWLPPWGPDRITEEGRAQLRALGFNI
jgi:metal-sulfur cluster biosynthetic enzyme